MGKTPPRSEKAYWGNDYKWVSIADMKDSEIIFDTKEGISQKGFVDKFASNISPKGTLIMSFKLTVGKVSILGMDALHNEAIISIFSFNDNNNVFRDYLFKVLPLMSNFGETKDAIKGRTLNSESINKLLIALPPINEQNRITKKINTLLPYIEKYNKSFIKLEALNNSYKEELKKSILQYAIQGKLVSQNSDDESADVLINKILEEKRELIKTKQIKKENLSVIYKDDTDNQFYEKFDDGTIINITDEIPFDIPDNWCWTRLKNICSVIRGLTFSKSTKEQINNTSLVLRGGNIDSKTEKLLFNDNIYVDSKIIKENQYIKKGDVLIVASSGTKSSVGKSTYVDVDLENTSFGGFMMVVRTNYLMNSRLISYNIKNLRQKIISETVGYISNITNPILNNLLIAVPPINEQNRIVDKTEKILNLLNS